MAIDSCRYNQSSNDSANLVLPCGSLIQLDCPRIWEKAGWRRIRGTSADLHQAFCVRIAILIIGVFFE
jgi:hypothetical protein